jgi:hypothetical protein
MVSRIQVQKSRAVPPISTCEPRRSASQFSQCTGPIARSASGRAVLGRGEARGLIKINLTADELGKLPPLHGEIATLTRRNPQLDGLAVWAHFAGATRPFIMHNGAPRLWNSPSAAEFKAGPTSTWTRPHASAIEPAPILSGAGFRGNRAFAR